MTRVTTWSSTRSVCRTGAGTGTGRRATSSAQVRRLRMSCSDDPTKHDGFRKSTLLVLDSANWLRRSVVASFGTVCVF